MAEPSQTVGSIRFGRFELSADTGELRKDGVRLKLSGQAIQVLVMLAASPGKLVTREELQQKLWPGASFGDPEHGLNAAVNKLRETLGDSATEPKYIETVPGRGYRFIAALESQGGTPEPRAPEPDPPRPPWWKRKATVAVAACVVVAGLLYPVLAPRIEGLRRQSEFERMTVVPLTTMPGSVEFVSFSPDGSQIAYTWQGDDDAWDLYVQVIGAEKVLRLTNHVGLIYGMAWSPDGKNIALWRRVRNNESGVYLVSPLGGPMRKVASIHGVNWYGNKVAWSPDSKQIAFVDGPEDPNTGWTEHLFRLSLDSLERTRVKTDCKLTTTPAFSPRGDYLAWSCPENMSYVSIQLERLGDGSVTELARGLDGVGGLAWSGDGRRVIYSTGYTGGDLWEIALDRPNRPEKLPFGQGASDLAVTIAGNRLAFNQNHKIVNIWRLNLSEPQPHAERLVASSREQHAPKYSPDGAQIAFDSNRTGSTEIWVSDADGLNAVQLTSFGVRQTGTARWSPDSKRIAFDSRVGGEANIYIVDPRGGAPKKLNIDLHDNSEPSWSHDGAWIYFANGEDAQHPSLWKVPSEGGHATQVAPFPARIPTESPDGQYIYFHRNSELWRVNMGGTDEEQVQGMPRLCNVGEAWVPFGSGIYFMGCGKDGQHVEYLDLATHQVKVIYKPLTPPGDWLGGLSVSPDGKYLLYSQIDEQSSNLMMVENWR